MFDIRRTLAGAVRTHRPYPVMRMVEWLRTLESYARDAEAGRPVYLHDLITDVRKDEVSAHALIRVLLLVLTVKRVSADDLAALERELKSTTESRRRPVRQPKRPGERLSPKLF